MRKFVRIGLTVLISTLVLFIGAILVTFFLTWFVFNESEDRSDVPLTRKEALGKAGAHLPSGATNVYYLFYAGGMQDLESYLRFDQPQGDLAAVCKEMIDSQNRQMQSSDVYTRTPIPPAAPHPGPRPEFEPMTWWDTSAIKRGFHLDADKQSYSLQIWVDEDQRRIYIYTND